MNYTLALGTTAKLSVLWVLGNRKQLDLEENWGNELKTNESNFYPYRHNESKVLVFLPLY